MSNKYFLSFIILGLGIIIAGFLLSSASAQTAADIQYPVKELGNCQNETACRAYCDKPGNLEACLTFAEKNNLMNQEELEQAKKFMAAGGKGPGGCTGKEACEEYCNDISRIDECVSFAEKNNLIPPQELAEAKKVQAAIKRGVKPPHCGNKKQCDVYCNESAHMEECITFGTEAGFIQGKELEDAQKMLAALKKGVKPPPCNGKEACDEYCSNPDNMEVCMNFAMEAGFMSEQEKQDSQKMLQALKKGVKPPACKGKEECDVYCSEESHLEECMKFAEAAGFMSPEQAEMARKTGGKGPGGCKGKEECEAFCNNPANQETCFNFGKEHGLIKEEDLRQMEEGKQRLKESFNQAPPEVTDCIRETVGTENFDKIQAGTLMPGPQIGDQMRTCFEQFMPQGPSQRMGPEGGPMMGPGGPQGMPAGFQGPGGCASPDECTKYCSDSAHQEECSKFGGGQTHGMMPPQGGMMPPANMVPGEMPQGMMPPGKGMPGEYKEGMQLMPGLPLQPPQEFKPPTDGQYPPPPGTGPTPSQSPGMMQPSEGMTPQQTPQPFVPGATAPPPNTNVPPPQSAAPSTFFGFISNTVNKVLGR